jgi:hypothetical protein
MLNFLGTILMNDVAWTKQQLHAAYEEVKAGRGLKDVAHGSCQYLYTG